MYVDSFNFRKFQDVIVCDDISKNKKPCELKHVFNISTGDYEVNEQHCCYFSPVTDFDDLVFSIVDEDIIGIEDGYVVGLKQGTTRLKVNYPSSNRTDVYLFSVYRKLLPTRNRKKSILLKQDSMIPLISILRHGVCTHNANCLFDLKSWEVYDEVLGEYIKKINSLKKQINELEYVLNCFLNGEIIYNELLEKDYNIEITKNIIDGKVSYSTSVTVNDYFQDHIKKQMHMLKKELDFLNREIFKLSK